jgi:hypothetical protein
MDKVLMSSEPSISTNHIDGQMFNILLNKHIIWWYLQTNVLVLFKDINFSFKIGQLWGYYRSYRRDNNCINFD